MFSQSYQAMTPFAEVFALAATRKGGEAALQRILATTAPRPLVEIASMPDDRINAQFLLDLKMEHGTAARFFANWADADYVGLLDVLKKRASHLGGDAAGRFLRGIGKPAFITSPDMVSAPIQEGVIDRAPTGKRDLAIIQAAFNNWSSKSGRDLTAISRILAMSVDFVGDGASGSPLWSAASLTRAPLRLEYEAQVMALHDLADAMHLDGSTPEAIARAMHAARRRLCQVFKDRTPELQRKRIFERTRAVYGDPFGPSVEFLRLQGKSWEHIIESASRPGRSPLEDSSSRDVGET